MDPPRADAAEAPFLRTLAAIRTRCAQVHDLAEKGALQYFDYHPARRDAVIAFCASIMQVCLGSFLPPPPRPIDARYQRDFANAFDTVRATPPPMMFSNPRRRSPLMADGATLTPVSPASRPSSNPGPPRASPPPNNANASSISSLSLSSSTPVLATTGRTPNPERDVRLPAQRVSGSLACTCFVRVCFQGLQNSLAASTVRPAMPF